MSKYLRWQDVSMMLGCGRSKAMLIINEIGPVHIGRTACVRADDLDRHIAEHGGVAVKWPPRKRRAGD